MVTRCHGQSQTYQCSNCPVHFVVQELKILAAYVKQSSNQKYQQPQGNCPHVIWRPEHSDLQSTTGQAVSCVHCATVHLAVIQLLSPGLTHKTTQVKSSCKTRTCVRTCDGWPNGIARWLASPPKSHKVINFTHIQMTCNRLVSTCFG